MRLGEKVFRLITRYCTISLLLFVLAGCGGSGGGSNNNQPTGGTPPPPPALNGLHYEGIGRFTVPYPAPWNQLRYNPGPPTFAFVEPSEGATDPFRELIQLAKVNIGSPTLRNDVSNIQQLSVGQTQMAGFTATETIFDADHAAAPGVPIRMMELAFDFAGSTYSLAYTAERARFNRLIDVARQMAREMIVGTVIFTDLSSTSDLSKPGLPAVANDGDSFLVISCRDRVPPNGRADLIARFVRSDRTLDTIEMLIHGAVDFDCERTRPTVTFDGANYLVAYSSFATNRRIVAKRINTLGQVIDAQPIEVSQNGLGRAYEPSSVFDGSRHVIAWHERYVDPVTAVESNQIRVSFVSVDGTPSNAIVITDALDQVYPPQHLRFRTQIALGNNRVMVVWEPHFEADTRTVARPIYAQIIDLPGTVLLPDPLLIRIDNGDNPRFAQVASDGQNFLVGWIEGLLSTIIIGRGQFGLYARQISPDGVLLNGSAATLGLEVMPQVSDLPKEYLNLSYDNDEYLFLWVNATHQTELGTYGIKVSRNLAPISPARPVSATVGNTHSLQFVRPAHPAISYSEGQTFVIWPAEDGMVEGWYLPPDFPN